MNLLSHHLFTWTNSLSRATPVLHGPARVFATYGVVLFGMALLVALWQARHASDTALASVGWAGLGTLVALGVNQPVGALFAEPRPYAGHPEVLVLVSRTTDWSFPSDHSVMAGACAVGLLVAARQHRAFRRLALLAVVAAALMAVDRVYVGAHYPLDVVAGLMLGGAVSAAGWLALRWLLVPVAAWLRRLPGVQSVFQARVGSGPEPGSAAMGPA
ncbi:phosphatase PAP2 family protein [Knoellia locipacati]|uniref:Phosphatase PAP2 family protein n=1 Tax=Knoellia locipacati TaxID=882824 RepID=A0A512SXC5_9MICO|nr:phosphatase PAP2 family protein [Knoellia locipacati]GEQ12620.1 phosphatase PAP2 family protein [Knoellia locipacati]